MLKKFAVLLVLQSAFCFAAFAAPPLPKGYEISPNSTSPNGEFCVIEPTRDAFFKAIESSSKINFYNAVVNAKTGKILEKVKDDYGIHDGPQFINDHALWSPDSSTLVWVIDSKWGPSSITVFRLANRHVISQTDLRTPIDNELLKRTKKAHPKIYKNAVKENAGCGSWYPDGFTIDIHVSPLTTNDVIFTAALTADPKDVQGWPNDAKIYALIDGKLGVHNKFTFTHFQCVPGSNDVPEELHFNF